MIFCGNKNKLVEFQDRLSFRGKVVSKEFLILQKLLFIVSGASSRRLFRISPSLRAKKDGILLPLHSSAVGRTSSHETKSDRIDYTLKARFVSSILTGKSDNWMNHKLCRSQDSRPAG